MTKSMQEKECYVSLLKEEKKKIAFCVNRSMSCSPVMGACFFSTEILSVKWIQHKLFRIFSVVYVMI